MGMAKEAPLLKKTLVTYLVATSFIRLLIESRQWLWWRQTAGVEMWGHKNV